MNTVVTPKCILLFSSFLRAFFKVNHFYWPTNALGVWQRNYAAKHRLRTRKISRVISVKHVQHSLRMDHEGSETCRGDF